MFYFKLFIFTKYSNICKLHPFWFMASCIYLSLKRENSEILERKVLRNKTASSTTIMHVHRFLIIRSMHKNILAAIILTYITGINSTIWC